MEKTIRMLRIFALAASQALALLTPALVTALDSDGNSDAGFMPLPLMEMGVVLGEGGDFHVLGNDLSVQASKAGLSLRRGSSTVRLADGRFESIDSRTVARADGTPLLLVSALDEEAGAVTVLLIDTENNRVAARGQLESPQAVAEVACLYQDVRSGSVSAFTVDARGMLDQRLVFLPGRDELLDLAVRREVGLVGAQACAVHDASASLYVADETQGVLRFSALEETDATPKLWMAPQPWGSLADEVDDLAVDGDGRVWALTPGAQRLDYRGVDNAVGSYALPEMVAADAVSVSGAEDGVLSLMVVEEATGAVYGSRLALPPPPDVGMQERTLASVTASAETVPVRRYGDAADDPAIYPGNAAQPPLLLGTDKREGLAVYDLDGQQRQFLPVGRLNNVDLLSEVSVNGTNHTIAAASNRTSQGISLFMVDNGEVRMVGEVSTGLSDVYGLCMYASDSGAYVFINDTTGAYEQYRLAWVADALTAKRVRRFTLPSQPEGCVADHETGRIYLGEEAAGVWEAGAEPDGDEPRLVIQTSDVLVADVEGMDIYRNGEEALLVVSSQGSDSYAVFDLQDAYRLRGAFEVVPNDVRGIDGVSETDGLAVSAVSLTAYPNGILVVQDGRNRRPHAPQNFKIIDWRDVQAVLSAAK